ncbi:V-type proton ATPase subunit E 2-like [Rhipicephalus sanguineus]|uniref:V-type proton ATPase subunit E 2-like n=1 Tax=Rhipicephalus sanguineus TaxID=34632 RepID=UPI0020C498CF|nr:V-type proton ATPase subunit E 2-like [Rhipicephalus sanguineus]
MSERSERRMSGVPSVTNPEEKINYLSHSGIDANKRMIYLLTYIENDMKSKVKETDAKTEEDYKAEKERILTHARARINEIVRTKEKEVEKRYKVAVSRIKIKARLSVLSARNELVAKVLAETRSKLTMITEKEARYKPFLERLILQMG